MKKETWKVYRITHNSNQYFKAGIWEVSDQGNVKHNGVQIDLNRYKHRRYISLSGFYVHQAVAELFVPNPDNKPEIDHIDGNKHNNKATNLRWVTHEENMNNLLTLKKNKETHIGQSAWNKGIIGVSDETSQKMKIAWQHRKCKKCCTQ